MNGSMHEPWSTAPTKSSLYEFDSGRREKNDRLLGGAPLYTIHLRFPDLVIGCLPRLLLLQRLFQTSWHNSPFSVYSRKMRIYQCPSHTPAVIWLSLCYLIYLFCFVWIWHTPLGGRVAATLIFSSIIKVYFNQYVDPNTTPFNAFKCKPI
jgi:hypothetical protein